jgi:hypothetical protein
MSNIKCICQHCKSHLGASCSDNHCHDCIENCTVCNKKLCVKYNLYSHYCKIGSITGSAHKCYICKKGICDEHYVKCEDCGGKVCNKCIKTHWKECAICKEVICEDSGVICSSCGCFKCYDAGCAYGDCLCKVHK